MSLRTLDFDLLNLGCSAGNLNLTVTASADFSLPSSTLSFISEQSLVRVLADMIWIPRSSCRLEIRFSLNGHDIGNQQRGLETLGTFIRDSSLWKQLSLSASLEILHPDKGDASQSQISLHIRPEDNEPPIQLPRQTWSTRSNGLHAPRSVPKADFKRLQIHFQLSSTSALPPSSRKKVKLRSQEPAVPGSRLITDGNQPLHYRDQQTNRNHGIVSLKALDNLHPSFAFSFPFGQQNLALQAYLPDPVFTVCGLDDDILFSLATQEMCLLPERLVQRQQPFSQPLFGHEPHSPGKQIEEEHQWTGKSTTQLEQIWTRAEQGLFHALGDDHMFLERQQEAPREEYQDEDDMLLSRQEEAALKGSADDDDDDMPFSQTPTTRSSPWFVTSNALSSWPPTSTTTSTPTPSTLAALPTLPTLKRLSPSLPTPSLTNSHALSLYTIALHILLLGHHPRILHGLPSITLLSPPPNPSTTLSTVHPTLFHPTFHTAMQSNSHFIPYISRTISSSWPSNVQSPSLRRKLRELAVVKCGISNDEEYMRMGTTRGQGTEEERMAKKLGDVVQARLWGMMRRGLWDGKALRKVTIERYTGGDEDKEGAGESEGFCDLLDDNGEERAMRAESGGSERIRPGNVDEDMIQDDTDGEVFDDLFSGGRDWEEDEGLLEHLEARNAETERREVEQATDETLFGSGERKELGYEGLLFDEDDDDDNVDEDLLI